MTCPQNCLWEYCSTTAVAAFSSETTHNNSPEEVKFKFIFEELKKINYKGSFTIESQRGKNIKNQATENYIFFKKLINQYLTKWIY